MQVANRRSSRSLKVSSSLLAAAVAAIGFVHAPARAAQWSATPDAAGFWSNPANWAGGVAPVNGESLAFYATTNYNPINDLVANTLITGITFEATGGSYNLSGNAINFSGELFNNSGMDQTISHGVNISGAAGFYMGNAKLTLAGALGGGQNLVLNDAGTLALTGVSTNFGGQLQIARGSVLLTSRLNSTQGGAIRIGTTGGQIGAFTIDGGTLNVTGDLNLATADLAQGYLRINNGVITTPGSINIAQGAATGSNRSAGMSLNGGSIIMSNGYFVVGFNNTTATYNQTGGLLTLASTNRIFTIGAGGTNSYGVANISGGEIHVGSGDGARSYRIGEAGSGVMTISGSALVTAAGGGNTSPRGTIVAQASNTAGTLTGVLNLNGGTLVSYVDKSNGRGDMSFNGGVLMANRSGNLIAGFNAAAVNGGDVWIRNGGAILDDNGYNATVASALQAPTGNGVSLANVTISGIGFYEAPAIQIVGGGGNGATAVASIDAAGNLTGITITNPGTGYTSEPTINVLGGGGSGGLSGSVQLVANTSTGGLTKRGPGTVTLNGLNTYTGPTVVTGTLNIAAGNNLTDAINSASALTLRAGTLQFSGTTGSSNSQTFASTTFGPGANTVLLSPNGTANAMTLNLGAITRNPGATLNVAATASTVTTLSANANYTSAGGQQSILGGYAVYNGQTFATSAGTGANAGAITGLATYEPSFVAGKDVDAPAGASTPGALAINSLRFNAAGAADVTASGALTVASGGILVTSNVGANNLTIAGTTLSAGTGNDLVLHNYNSNASSSLNISAQVIGTGALIKTGPGKVILSNAANAYTGKTAILGGTLNAASLGATGAGNDSLTIANRATLQLGAPLTIPAGRGILLDTTGGIIDTNGFDGTVNSVISGTGSLTKVGTGNLTLAGINTYEGYTTVSGGSLTITGLVAPKFHYSQNTFANNAHPTITVGTLANVPTAIVVDGGTLTASKPNAPSLVVGNTSGSQAYLYVKNGVVTSASEMFLGGNATAGQFSHMTLSGGSVTIGSWFSMGRGTGAATYLQTGGVMNVTTGYMAIANTNGGAIALADFAGGTYNADTNNGGLYVGENGRGVANISGAAQVNLANNGLRVGVAANSYGVANLFGGTVTTNRVQLANTNSTAATTVGLLNFHGGTLRASTNTTQFISNTGTLNTNNAAAYIWNAGGTIDDNGFNITIPAALATPDGNGISAIAIDNGGSGYLTAPVVNITGGGGKGATASALMAGGVVTGIQITNPGVGYTDAPTITFVGGSGSGAVSTSSTLLANATPGAFLNKTGTGTVTLSSLDHTYTGGINVNAGLLRIVGPGGAAPYANYKGSVTVNSGGRLFGSGTIALGVTVNDGGTIDLMDNVAGTLTLASGLTAGGPTGSLLKFDFAGDANPANGNDMIVLGGSAFTVNGSVKIALNNLGSMATGNSYTLMTYGSNSNPANVTFENGLTTTIVGFDTATLVVDNSKVMVNISGSAIPTQAWWSGQLGANWSDISGSNSNFNTSAAGNVNTHRYPSSITDVFFGTTTPAATNLNTTLGGNFNVKSVTVKTGTSPVSIAGTHILGIGSGGITLETGSSLSISSLVNLQANQTWRGQSESPLTVSGVISGTGALTTQGNVALSGNNTFTGGVNAGAGTLRLTSANALGTGPLATVPGQGAYIRINGAVVESYNVNIDATAVIEGDAANGALRVNTSTASTSTFLGTLKDGDMGGLLGLTILGGGTLTVGNAGNTANINHNGQIIVRNGTMNVVNANIASMGAAFLVADTNNQRARLIVDGNVNITSRNSRQSFQVGSAAGALGELRVNAGSISSSGPTGEFWLGEEGSGSSYAALTMTGGNVNAGSFMVVGFNGDRAIVNQTGGTINVGTNTMTIGAGGSLSMGVVNISGGDITAMGNGVYVGENGLGILNMTGAARVTAAGNGVQLANNAGSTGILNLNGGTLAATRVYGSGGTSNVNFHGGRLQNNNNTTGTFLYGLTSATVWSEGANIDDAGGSFTISQNLLAPTGNGLGGGTLAVSGYTNAFNTPLVQITGGGGTGATGLANLDAAGAVTSITITNPGTGYTAAPTISLQGAGFTQATNSSIAAVSLVANSSLGAGSFNKYGSGTITLTGNNNTYAGPTTVHEGTLRLGGAARLVNTSSVTVNSGAAIIFNTGSTLGVNLTSNGGTVSMADDNVGTLTLGPTLTLNGGSLVVDISATTSDLLTTGQFIGSNATVKINNLGMQPGMTYTIANFSSSSYSAFTLDPASATIGVNTLQLVTNPTSLQITVNGPALPATAFWTGALGDRWDAISGADTNFNTTIDGGVNTKQLPGAITKVTFATTNPAAQNLTTNLGSSMVINSLTINSGNNVVINGTNAAVLAIEGADGIDIKAGASLVLNTHLVLGAVQTWNNQSGAPLVVTGNISGTGGFSYTTNDLVLNSSNNTFSGGVTLGSTTVVTLNGNGGLGSGPTTFGGTNRIDLAGGITAGIGTPINNAGVLVQNIGGTTSTFVINTPVASTWQGTLQNGTDPNATLGLRLTAPTAADYGTLTLAATQNFSGALQVDRGALILPAGVSLADSAMSIRVGGAAGKAMLVLNGGTITRTGQNPSLQIGAANEGNGVFIMNGGLVTLAQEVWPSTANGGYGKLEINGGTMTVNNWVALSRGGGHGLMNINAGKLAITAQNLSIGSFGGNVAGGIRAVVNVNGGILDVTNAIFVGEGYYGVANNGVLNVNGGQVFARGARGIELATTTTDVTTENPRTGIVNLGGGTITTPIVQVGNNAGASGLRRALFNFNGGVLQASASSGTFMNGFSSTASAFSGAYIWTGHANIDDNGNSITVGTPLLAPTGNGISTAGLTIAGTGYIAEPVISVVGGGGYGATVDGLIDAAGNLTGIRITNPGVGYTSVPTFEVNGGGGTGTIVATDATLVTNPTTGGVNKIGSGTLTFTGVGSTYGGPTNITAGTAVWNANGASAAAITGAGKAVVNAGSNLTSNGVTVASWQVDGTHIIRSNGNNTSKVATGALTIAGTTGAWTGKLDLTNNALVVTATDAAVQASTMAQLKEQIASGRANGSWNGNGITSSTMTSSSFATAYTLAMADAGDLGLTSFRGQAGLDANSTIVVLARNGDATLDNVVDAFDLNILAANWQTNGKIWSSGDFTGDGLVDAFDLNMLAANWQFGIGGSLQAALSQVGLGGVAAVPEPASLAVLALGSAALMTRRRRKA